MARIIPARFEFKEATPEQWAVSTLILRRSEPGREVFPDGSSKLKFGNGIDLWNGLPYFATGSGGGPSDEELLEHINSLTPHPGYDDAPSFELLYENAKV